MEARANPVLTILRNMAVGATRLEVGLEDKGGRNLVFNRSLGLGPDLLLVHDADRLLGGQSLVPENDRKPGGLRQPGRESARLLGPCARAPVHTQREPDHDLAHFLPPGEIAEVGFVLGLPAEPVLTQGVGGEPQGVAQGKADMDITEINSQDPHRASLSRQRFFRRCLSKPRRMSCYTSRPKGIPLPATRWG